MNNLRSSLQTALLGNFAIFTTQGLQQLVRCSAYSYSLLTTRPAFVFYRIFHSSLLSFSFRKVMHTARLPLLILATRFNMPTTSFHLVAQWVNLDPPPLSLLI